MAGGVDFDGFDGVVDSSDPGVVSAVVVGGDFGPKEMVVGRVAAGVVVGVFRPRFLDGDANMQVTNSTAARTRSHLLQEHHRDAACNTTGYNGIHLIQTDSLIGILN